ncbi:MAG TPA: sugar ABC transporter ATP-binding protein [bacterium]|nr:sugar ABC transporter ATP-binding protein [bacterium]
MAERIDTPLLTMRGVNKAFGATTALDGVDFAVAAGEVHALVGENGAGKSTLMKVLSGAQRPDAGEMTLAGAPYRPRDPLDARRSGVAMIYQELSLAGHLTVEENIVLGLEPMRRGLIDRREARRLSEEALALLGHPEISVRARVQSLSVSSRQIVEIARALALGCRVLVLDEPTSALSGSDVERLFECVRRLSGQGRAIVYISHFLEEVTRIADRFTVLRDGKVAGSGPIAGTGVNEIVGMMVGKKIEQMYPRGARAAGEEVLSVADLAGLTKPNSASLSLKRGEVLGIAGLMGAGRTELIRAIFGLDPVRSGRIKVGAYVGPASPARRWAQGVGMLSEDRKGEGLALPLTLADNITLSRLGGLGPLGLVLPSRRDAAARRRIEELSIRCRGPRQRASELSGGNQQKAALARLLHHDVDVLLLDEPTRGIDVASKARVYRLIDELATGSQGKRAKAVLMVSSYLPELLGVCDRVAVMYRGRLGPARPVGGLDQRTLMLEATGQGGADES